MTRVAIPLVVVLLGAGVAGKQARDSASQPQTGTSVIAGTVLTTDTGPQPVRSATITVSGGGLRMQRQTMTDSGGRFVVADLPAGTFSLSVSKPAFISTNYGARQPGQPGTPVVVTAGQRVQLDVRMPRGAVLAGTLLDQFGQPRSQVRMQAFAYRAQGGQRRLQPSGSTAGTDDRGAFRLYGLPPGEYVLLAVAQETPEVRMVTAEETRWAQTDPRPGQYSAAATPPPAAGPTVGFAPIYFPGVADISGATTITLNAGEERLGMDFQLQPTATAKIEGVLLDPDGRPPQQVQLTLLPDERLRSPLLVPRLGTPSENGRIDSQTGKFTFAGVVPGRYTVVASQTLRAAPPMPPVPPTPPPAPGAARGVGPAPPPPVAPPPPKTFWAMAEVDVAGRDIGGLALTLQPPFSISGRVVFESSTQASPTDTSRVRINISQVDSLPIGVSIPGVAANADGTFVLQGAVPGRYRISGNAPPSPGQGAWGLKSVVAGGREALDSALEVTSTDLSDVVVTFTDRLTDLSGTLLDAAGAPTREFWVLLFSTDRSFWTPQSRRTRVIRPGTDGRFRFPQFPPGDYYLVAVTDGDQMDLTDRVAMEQIAAVAYRVTLAEGERKVQDLKVAR